MAIVYELSVWDTIKSGWEKTYGAKGSIWAAIAILFIVVIALGFAQGIFKEAVPPLLFIISIIAQLILLLLQMGLVLIGAKRALSENVSYTLIFKPFEWNYAIRIIGLYLSITVLFLCIAFILMIPTFLTAIGIIFALMMTITVIIFVYLGLRFSLAMAFVLMQEAGPIQALKLSWNATEGNFWNILGVYLLLILFLIISAIPFGIGLVWTIPFHYVTYGEVYRQLLGNCDMPTAPKTQAV